MILICEAERELCNIYRMFLEKDGHECLLAHTYREGIEALHQHADRLDMLIADYTLPDGFGDNLVLEARRARPEALAILISGYHNISVPDGALFLGKPFLPSRLRELASAMLDRGPPDPDAHRADALGGNPAHQG